MTITAELADGTTLEFPDGTDRAVIQGVVKKRMGMAAAAPAPIAAPERSLADKMGNVLGGIVEPLTSMASGAVAKPVSELAGLGALPFAMGGADIDPTAIQQRVQQALTLEPQTEYGKAEGNPLNLIPKIIGEGFDWAGGGIGKGVGGIADYLGAPGEVSRGLERGVHEGVNQIPNFIGIKAPAAGQAAKRVLQGENPAIGALSWMESALSPSAADRRSGAGRRAAQTALDEGVNVTHGGTERLTTGRLGIDEMDSLVADALRNSTRTGNKFDVTQRFDPELRSAMTDPLGESRLRSIANAADYFLAQDPARPGNPLTRNRADIPVQQLQEMKREAYRQAQDSYGTPELNQTKRNYMTLGRGLKEVIEEQHPEVRGANARTSELINLRDMIDEKLSGAASRRILGSGMLPGRNLVARALGNSELVRSWVARLLNETGEAMPGAGMALAPGAIATSQYADKADEDRERKRLAELLKQ